MVPTPAVNPSVRTLKQQGDKAYASRDFGSAIERYSEALEIVEDAVVLSNRSATHAQKQNHEKALNDAQRAMKLQPSWPRLYHRCGHSLFHLGRFTEAIKSFEAGLKLDPEDSFLVDGLKDLLQYTEPALGNGGEKEYVEPEEEAPAAPAAPSEEPAGAFSPPPRRSGAFSAAAAGGGASPTAGAQTKSASDDAPPTADELRDKGNGFYRAGKFSAAIKAYNAAVDANPDDARNWANRAAAQIGMLSEFGKGMPPAKLRENPYYANSLNDLNKAIALDSKYVKAWARKGQLHAMVSEFQQAVTAFERGLAVDESSRECRQGRDQCRAKMGYA
mmetsp:Transcript_74513/g.136159  ORF Transcript_74513/g.136159 Transcript_74513/m.136159 type:complete len:332 (-) Transcript_74513:39-1034(-)